MSPRFVLGQEKVPCVAEVVNRSLKADCTDFNGQIFWTLLKAIKGKIIVNTCWELAYAIKQTRRDRMAKTVDHITFLQLFYAWSVCFLL